MKKKLAAAVLLVILLLGALYFLFPEFVFKLAQEANRHSAGLVKKEVQVDSDRIVYLEGGKGETVLLLHGYTADKDFWTYFAKRLTGEYHIVVPDLAGFGESTKRLDENYSIDSQVKRLDRFAEVLQMEKFHLAGNSMGGTIAAVYSAKFPHKIVTLALLAPGGLKTANASDYYRQLQKGINPLLIGSPDDFENVLTYAYVKPPAMPGAFKRVLAARAMAAREFNEKIGRDLFGERLVLEAFLPMIQAPVLIIWGDKDRILDVSGASILKKGLQNNRTFILKDTGHMPMLEKPEETAAAYVSFLKNQPGM